MKKDRLHKYPKPTLHQYEKQNPRRGFKMLGGCQLFQSLKKRMYPKPEAIYAIQRYETQIREQRRRKYPTKQYRP